MVPIISAWAPHARYLFSTEKTMPNLRTGRRVDAGGWLPIDFLGAWIPSFC
jgi:hypothetical protein